VVWSALLTVLAIALSAGAAGAREKPMSSAQIAPAPAGEAMFDRFTVTVDGQPAPVYVCRVSAMPFNQVWPGYQRPIDQTELAGFARWDQSDPVEVAITCRDDFEQVVLRPASLGLEPVVEGRTIRFSLPEPRAVVVEIDGPHSPLHLMASPPETDPPAAAAPGVTYFGPGVHHPGRINLVSDETLYVAAGAVVYGSVHADGAENIKILGRGILDVSGYERGQGGGAIRLHNCSQVTIDGLTLRDPDVWCCSLFGCRDASLSNLMLIGLWRYNADGIDVCNSQRVTVRDCFVRAYDDAIVLKGLQGNRDEPVEDIDVSGCTVWCDWGRALELGAETCAPRFTHIRFHDCDIVRTTHIAMDIQHGDRAAISDVWFESIRVEMDDPNPQPRLQKDKDDRYTAPAVDYLPSLFVIVIRGTPYSKDTERGTVRDVVFQDITVTAPRVPPSSLRGADADHTVDGVVFTNIVINGRRATDLTTAGIVVGDYVSDVTIEAGG